MQEQLTDRNWQLMARQSKLLAGPSPCFRIETLKMVLQANKFSFNSKYFVHFVSKKEERLKIAIADNLQHQMATDVG